MSVRQYVAVFFKYMFRAQPLLLWTWFWTSIVIFVQTIRHAILGKLTNPLTTEDRINEIARKSNATSRMVREMRGLFATPVAKNPLKILKELWLDRAFMLLISMFALLYLFLLVDRLYDISFYWIFLPSTATMTSLSQPSKLKKKTKTDDQEESSFPAKSR